MNDSLIEEKIKLYFEENYELLRYEAGHDVTAEVRKQALQQVLMYWRKLKTIAESVTETEVKLALPEQVSPEQRKFTIEGVVDIVREGNETWMYDLKTHDLDFIQRNIEIYEQQLNIYAHIWKGLRGNALDHTAIISTALPVALREAVKRNDEKFIEHELAKWNPLVEIELKQENIDELINNFGETVDEIENSHFQPAALATLKASAGGRNSKENFATRVCRNCDARFSCSSYREYAATSQGKNLYNFRQFWIDPIPDAEQEEWLEENMNDTLIEQAANRADLLS